MTQVQAMASSLIRTFDFAWNRLLTRCQQLEDEEYLWEPVAGCWSLRPTFDGHWLLDGHGGGGPVPDPIPVTTIVWRLGHIGGTVGGFARMVFGDGLRLTSTELAVPPSAEYVQDFLTINYRNWVEGLATLSELQWSQQLGEAFGPYAAADMYDLALHVLDELLHHAAEVGVLRDLWSAGLR